MYLFFLVQASDALDGLLEELHYLDDQTEHADPIAVSPDAIREQITENNVRRTLPHPKAISNTAYIYT